MVSPCGSCLKAAAAHGSTSTWGQKQHTVRGGADGWAAGQHRTQRRERPAGGGVGGGGASARTWPVVAARRSPGCVAGWRAPDASFGCCWAAGGGLAAAHASRAGCAGPVHRCWNWACAWAARWTWLEVLRAAGGLPTTCGAGPVAGWTVLRPLRYTWEWRAGRRGLQVSTAVRRTPWQWQSAPVTLLWLPSAPIALCSCLQDP